MNIEIAGAIYWRESRENKDASLAMPMSTRKQKLNNFLP